ncbi:MAG: TolC family protein [Deltaproteobacteria bacterium]|nr:TolC family protein [Deltaproteobacteria bacterium]
MKLRWLFVALVLLAGCAAYTPKPIVPSETLSRFESRTLDDPGLKEFIGRNRPRDLPAWPPAQWGLRLLTLAAFYYHPDLDVARAEWGVARAGVITAGQRPNPGAVFGPGYNASSASGISPWIFGFSLDVPLETAGKRGYRVARAGHLAQAARLNIAAAAWKVRSRLRARMLELQAAVETAALRERERAIRAELVQALEKRLAAGEVSRPEVTRARISLDRTVLLLGDARKRIAEARVAVADAIGVPAAALEGHDVSFDFVNELPADLPPADVRREALLNRPDILASLAEYEAAQSSLQLEIARQYPDLRLGPGYKWDQGDNKWSLGFSVSLPVFNRNQGPIAEAEARRAESAARFTALQARVIGESDRALAGYRESLKKLEAADALLASQRSRRQSAEEMFRAGEADRLTLLGARLELETGALARLEALAGVQRALGRLEDAVERPLVPAEEFPPTPTMPPRPGAGGSR